MEQITEMVKRSLKVVGLEELEDINGIIEKIAIARGCLKKGGEADTEKAARIIIDDLRSLKLGNITLEKVSDL